MKKALILVVFMFAFRIVNAQGNTNDTIRHKWELGIEGGPNTAYISGWAFNTMSWRTGFCTGLTAQYNVSRMFSLKSGIMYEQKGDMSSQEWTDSLGRPISGSSIATEDKLNYLIVPVFAKVAFGRRTKFFVDAGPWFGYLLDATYTSSVTHTGSTTMNSIRSEISDFQRADMGLSAGAGLEVPIKNKFVIDLELRYNQGLLNTDNHSTNPYYPQAFSLPVLTNESIDLLLGFRYKL